MQPEMTAQSPPCISISAKRVNVLSAVIISGVLVSTAWGLLFALGDSVVTDLQIISSKLKMIDLNDGITLSALILITSLVAMTATMLLPRAPRLLMFLMILSFAFAEALVPLVGWAAFGLRYLLMCVLVSIGIASLANIQLKDLDETRMVGIAFLAWSAINVAINGATLESLSMLPIQGTLVIGLLLGFSSIYRSHKEIESVGVTFLWVAIIVTGIHAIVAVLDSDAYLTGRFRSLFILPTSFGNNYVLFCVVMLWQLFRMKGFVITVVSGICLIVGLSLLVLSGTRNAVVILSAATLVFVITWRTKGVLIIGVSAVMLVALTATFLSDSRILQATHERATQRESLDARKQLWAISWEFIRAKPIVGYGLGKLADGISSERSPSMRLNSHNTYLALWLQLGFLGMFFILWLYMIGFLRGLRVIKRPEIPFSTRQVVALALSLLGGLFAGGFFEENMTNRGGLQLVVWGVALAVINSIYALSKDSRRGTKVFATAHSSSRELTSH